jgi:hypothetical protein
MHYNANSKLEGTLLSVHSCGPTTGGRRETSKEGTYTQCAWTYRAYPHPVPNSQHVKWPWLKCPKRVSKPMKTSLQILRVGHGRRGGFSKRAQARNPKTTPSLICFLLVPTHVRREIRPRGHIHDRIEHQHTTRLVEKLRAFILRAIVCRAPNVRRAIVCQASTVRSAIVCQAFTVHRASVCDNF